MNCFRFLGFTSLYDIEVLTLYEYEARMYAFRLKQADEELKMHKQAWINHQVTATKEQGKKQVPVYKSFKQFFDYEKHINNIEQEFKGETRLPERLRKFAQIAQKLNEGR